MPEKIVQLNEQVIRGANHETGLLQFRRSPH